MPRSRDRFGAGFVHARRTRCRSATHQKTHPPRGGHAPNVSLPTSLSQSPDLVPAHATPPRHETGFAYEELKADGRTCPVHVYVSTADVDSCSAFRILKSMMCSDGIPFSAYPVGGYQELQGLGDKLPKDGQNRSIVLINCGGTENVKELMSKCTCREKVSRSRGLRFQTFPQETTD